MIAFVLGEIFFPLVTYGAKDPSSVTSPRLSQIKTSVKPSKVSVKSSPLKEAASKIILDKSAPLPVSAPAVKSVSPLPVVDTAATEIVNFFPALNKENIAVKGASATVVAAQGAVTTQKGVVQADTAALQTAKSQETTLKGTLAINTAAVSQDKGLVATDTVELHRGDQLLASATADASSASANVDALTTQKQTLSKSVASSNEALTQTQQDIASLKAQIAGLTLIVSKDSPDATLKKDQIAKLTIQLQEKKNQQEAAQNLLGKDTATLTSIAQKLATAQNIAAAASSNLQSLQDSLKSNTAALAAAQKALGIENASEKSVQALAATYALQAATAEKGVLAETQKENTLRNLLLSQERVKAGQQVVNDDEAQVQMLQKQANQEEAAAQKLFTSLYSSAATNIENSAPTRFWPIDSQRNAEGNHAYSEALNAYKLTLSQMGQDKTALSRARAETQQETALNKLLSSLSSEAGLKAETQISNTDEAQIQALQKQAEGFTAQNNDIYTKFYNIGVSDWGPVTGAWKSLSLNFAKNSQQDTLAYYANLSGYSSDMAQIIEDKNSLVQVQSNLTQYKALQADTTTVQQDQGNVNDDLSQQKAADTTATKDASLIKSYQATIEAKKALIAALPVAQQTLYSDEESVFHLTQEAASDLSSMETGSSPKSTVSPDQSFQTFYDSLAPLQSNVSGATKSLETAQQALGTTGLSLEAVQELARTDALQASQAESTLGKEVSLVAQEQAELKPSIYNNDQVPELKLDITQDIEGYNDLENYANALQNSDPSNSNIKTYFGYANQWKTLENEEGALIKNTETLQQNQATIARYDAVKAFLTADTLVSKDTQAATSAQQALNLNLTERGGLTQWSKEISKELSSPQNLGTLRGSVASDNASISSLNTDISQDKNALTQMSSQYNADDPRLIADRKKLAQANTLYDTQATDLLKQKDHLTQLNVTLDQASASLQTSRNTVKAQTQKVSEDTTALQKAEQALTTAEQTVTTTSGTLTSLQSRVAQLQSTVSQSQTALDNLHVQEAKDEDTVTTLQQQKTNLEGEIQAQVSRYNDLVAQATASRELWNNQGSRAAGQAYDALVQEIQTVNTSLKTLGGQELPNLPFIPTNELNPIPPIVPSDDTTDTSETPDITDDAEQDDDATASELDAQGDERDDALIAKRQDLSGGVIAPTPGLAGVIGAESVTGDVTASTTSTASQPSQ